MAIELKQTAFQNRYATHSTQLKLLAQKERQIEMTKFKFIETSLNAKYLNI